MAKTSNGFDLVDENGPITEYLAVTLQTICTAGANGSRVMEILVHSDDTAATNITISKKLGSLTIPIKVATIAAGQGNSISAPDRKRLINSDSDFITGRLFDRDQNFFLVLEAGAILEASLSTLTSGKKVKVEVVKRDW